MEFGNLIEDELVTNSWMFEMLKHLKGLIKNTMNVSLRTEKFFIEIETSLLELVLNLSNLYKYKIKDEKQGYLKPILFWLYWKNRETFEKKFKKHFNLGEDLHYETKNFIKIYLEYKNDVFV